MTRILSGIQPTGSPHLGNYIGAIRHWVADQYEAETFYCVVDLHALTVPRDPAAQRADTLAMATRLLAFGIDPSHSTLFVQSHVPAHSELTWLLECTASMGEMARMTQFKDKAAKGGEEAARVGLFAYPILMAADILLYQATHVPVGDDQRQHLELTRNLAERFNTRYAPVFTVPEAAIPNPGRGARIMDLQDPTRKMSKSAETDAGLIGIFDPPSTIERKIKRAVTDADTGPGAVRWDRAAKPGVANLIELLAVLTDRSADAVAAEHDRYGSLKQAVADAVVALVEPVQARYAELSADPGYVSKVLAEGAARATSVADATLRAAQDAIGLLAPG